MLQQPTPDQSFQNVALVIRQFKGTADEHQTLSSSLRVIADRLNKLANLEKEAAKPAEPEQADAPKRRGRGKAHLEAAPEPAQTEAAAPLN